MKDNYFCPYCGSEKKEHKCNPDPDKVIYRLSKLTVKQLNSNINERESIKL